MATGIGIDLHNGKGRTALDDRRINFGLWESFGTVHGCEVSVGSGLTYGVGFIGATNSVAVASRGASDGAVIFPVQAGSVSTTAGPSSGSRLDVVWARQLDPSKGDSSNEVVLGVTQGQASSGDPVEPVPPVGAVVLGVLHVPQGMTRTNQVVLRRRGDQALPYGSSLGVLFDATDKSNSSLLRRVKTTMFTGEFTLPTKRWVELQLRPTISTPENVDEHGSVQWAMYIDGRIFRTNQLTFSMSWETKTWTEETKLERGRHTVEVIYWFAGTNEPDAIRRFGESRLSVGGGLTWIHPGTRFVVRDLGLAA